MTQENKVFKQFLKILKIDLFMVIFCFFLLYLCICHSSPHSTHKPNFWHVGSMWHRKSRKKFFENLHFWRSVFFINIYKNIFLNIIVWFRRWIINRHDEIIPKRVYFLYFDCCDVIHDVTKVLGIILY